MPRSRFIALSVALDAIFINVGVVLAYFVRFTGALPTFNFGPYLVLSPIVTLIYLGAGYIYDVYQPERTENAWSLSRAVVSAVTVGTLLFTAISFFAGPRLRFSLSRLAILLSWPAISLLLIGWRLVFLHFSAVTWPEQRVLLLGTGPLAQELAEELVKRSQWGYRMVGFAAVSPMREGRSTLAGLPVFDGSGDVTTILREQKVDRLIIVSPVAIRELVEELVLAEELDVIVDVVPELYEVFIGRVDSMVGDISISRSCRSRGRRCLPGSPVRSAWSTSSWPAC